MKRKIWGELTLHDNLGRFQRTLTLRHEVREETDESPVLSLLAIDRTKRL